MKEYQVFMSNNSEYHVFFQPKYDLTFIDMVKNSDGIMPITDKLFGFLYINTKQIVSIQEIKPK